jgi:replicative DNA helicase
VNADGGILNEGERDRSYPLEKMLNAGRRQKVHHLDNVGDRVPPHSKDAEMAVLGAMMLEKEASSKVIQIIPADAFYHETHRVIFQAMLALADRNQPIDIITLNDELRRVGRLQDVGGSHYLSELNMRTPTAANVEHHARIVFEKALKRRLIGAAMEIIGNCYSETTDAFEEVDHAEKRIFEIAESRNSRSYHSMKRLAVETVEMLELIHSRHEEGGGVIGVPAGLSKLDALTGGFQKSDMIIVAARPSMGKTALAMSMARNAAIDYKKAVAFFSLEMSAPQLVMRLISAEAKVDAHRLRTGDLKADHWQQIVSTVHRLAEAPIYIDDTPALGIMELRARARLMRREHNIEMIVVDYLQLMHAPKAESREREISMISRGLKQLAKELDIPIIALSQLNRSVESRGDKRPMLSDLRESGCLTGDTLVQVADSGRQVPIRSLVGKSGYGIWALNEETMKLERCEVSRGFSTGVKPVYRLTTRLGRTIRATGNHKFRGFDGWKRLDAFATGERLALPRLLPEIANQSLGDDELALMGHLIGDGCTLPRHVVQYTTREIDLAERVVGLATCIFGDAVAPRIVRERDWYQVYLTSTRHHTHGVRNAVAAWLDGMGIWGLRSHEKFVPDQVFEQSNNAIAHFLRHLWATDGCIRFASTYRTPAVYYASSSERLARDVQSLLLRLGINAWLRRRSQNGKGRDQFHVVVTGNQDLELFTRIVGGVGKYKADAVQLVRGYLKDRVANTNRDVIPRSFWASHVTPALEHQGMKTSDLVQSLNMIGPVSLSTLQRSNVSRERASRIARAVNSPTIERLADSDVYWDEVVAIEPDGVEEVFDLTVPGPHNFVANNIIVHNSIEQDADVVLFVHRPEYYGITVDEDGLPTEGTAEVIIGKQRNGPTGVAKMAFIKEYARFENLAFQYDNAPQYLPPSSDDAPF